MKRKPPFGLAHRRLVAALAAIEFLAWAGNAAAEDYQSKAYGWSVTLPAGWTIDERDAQQVIFREPVASRPMLFMVHSAAQKVPSVNSVEALADVVLLHRVKLFLAAGKPCTLLRRASGSLADGTRYVDLEEQIGAGVVGHAEFRFFLVDKLMIVLDAETFEEAWLNAAPIVDGIFASFHPPAAAPAGN